jgi:hypothetical protein
LLLRRLCSWQCLFHHQGNAFPSVKRPGTDWFLIQGGSSSVGLFAVQLAKLIGYKVVATCSPHSYDLVKAYGADAVVDYHDVPTAIEQVKQVTGGGVAGALEGIGGVPNGQLAVDSIRDGGGLVTCLIAIPPEIAQRRSDVKVERILVYTVFGYVGDAAEDKSLTRQAFDFLPGVRLPHKPQDHAWYQDLVKHSYELLDKYGVKGNPTSVREGLEQVPANLEDLRVSTEPLSGIRTPPLASADVSRPVGCPVQSWSSRCDGPWHHNTVSAAAMYSFSEPRRRRTFQQVDGEKAGCCMCSK